MQKAKCAKYGAYGLITILLELKFHGGLQKKSSRSDQPLPSYLLKPFPHCKCQSLNSRQNTSAKRQTRFSSLAGQRLVKYGADNQ